jgi:hypothetical protein
VKKKEQFSSHSLPKYVVVIFLFFEMEVLGVLFFPIEVLWTCIASVFWMGSAAVTVLFALIVSPLFLLTGRTKSYAKFNASVADWYWGGTYTH